ncbi:head-tail connector protein [Clostridium thermosuccinogenes]|uniref:head-tail connector protein n=1 Tax=Clostridium thermosuccinogenes TaxID=84032 RepID=UPI000CCC8813|nr:head-tail connector protein [Pseudoclostridium thermosuccinogenes]PNT94152.1 hypothetical protein CDQ83_11935 [Pseudoclostridium thermosuccinogenes]
MLDEMKLILDIKDTSKDDLLNLYLQKAQTKFKNYCNRDDIPVEADSSITDYAIVLYNKRKSEGLQSESYSGVNQSFETGIPADIKSEWNAFRKVRLI